MTWTKLCDNFYDSPKVLRAGNEATGVFARVLSYCGRHNLDGVIPKAKARELGRRKMLERMTEVGLWEERDDHYFIPDYLDFNPSKSEVEERRAEWRKRQRKKRNVTP